jgi:hypothetical protein
MRESSIQQTLRHTLLVVQARLHQTLLRCTMQKTLMRSVVTGRYIQLAFKALWSGPSQE